MSDTKKYETRLYGVGCDVSECHYHTEANCCCADAIKVRNESAQQKTETYCGTFKPKCECGSTGCTPC